MKRDEGTVDDVVNKTGFCSMKALHHQVFISSRSGNLLRSKEDSPQTDS